VTPGDPGAEAGLDHLRPEDLPLPQTLGHHRSHTQGSTDTLGSNFTVDEEHMLRTDEVPGQQLSTAEEHDRQDHDHDIPRSPRSMERIEGGAELIHVPQVAEKRYSWEEGGSMG
jgi:hypothetical protein